MVFLKMKTRQNNKPTKQKQRQKTLCHWRQLVPNLSVLRTVAGTLAGCLSRASPVVVLDGARTWFDGIMFGWSLYCSSQHCQISSYSSTFKGLWWCLPQERAETTSGSLAIHPWVHFFSKFWGAMPLPPTRSPQTSTGSNPLRAHSNSYKFPINHPPINLN